MIDSILRDSELRPDLFFWWGELSLPAVEDWENEQAIHVPSDLKNLWSTKGGVDIFESESILQPFGAADYDLIGCVSETFWRKGLAPEYVVFHIGLGTSVFRKSDGAIFYLDSADMSQMSPSRDLDEWYRNKLRLEFADRYGLAPLA
jgi:hypothetical protein